MSILQRAISSSCLHQRFIIEESLNFVECAVCGKQLNPMWVLMRLRNHEAALGKRLDILNVLAAKAQKKNQCKCMHCGEITKVYR